MSLRKDVHELLCLYERAHPREAFKPARLIPDGPPPPLRPEGKLVFRSELPNHLEPAYDIAIGEGLLEQHILKPEEQLEWYRSMGWPKGLPDVPQDKPWPVVPDWSDAIVVITDKGRAAIAMHSTTSGMLSGRLEVDLACMTATLDNTVFEVKSQHALRWLRILVEHSGEWISGKDLETYDSELMQVRTHRLKTHLPAEISALIDSDTGKGSRIRFEA